MSDAPRFPYSELRDRIYSALRRAGLDEPVAEIEAEIMVEADLLGVPSHGVRMLPGLLSAIQSGSLNSHPQLTILRDSGPVCHLDGDRGPGRFISHHSMANAIQRAGQFGLGVCLTRQTSHWGRAHAYAFRAAQAGMIGLCTTNAMPSMLGFGSESPILGNNPIAIGVPRENGEHVVLDLALSQAAVGKVTTYKREGHPVPLGWGLDSNGQPTTDPGAILESHKFLPMGEHKGAGLSLIVELLTAALANGPLTFELSEADPSGLDIGSTKLFVALDPRAFTAGHEYGMRVEAMIAYLEQSNTSPGSASYPGQRGWAARARNLTDGVPLHPDIVESLRSAGVVLET